MQQRTISITRSTLIGGVTVAWVLACGANVEKNNQPPGTTGVASATGGGGSGVSGAGGGGSIGSDTNGSNVSSSGGTGTTTTSQAATTGASEGQTASGATSGLSTASTMTAGGIGGTGSSDVAAVTSTTSTGGSAGAGTTSAGGVGGSGSGGTTSTTGAVGAVETLGTPCDTPGQLACAGNHQKLSLVCGGDGEWEINETCEVDEFCDTAAGDSTGLCRTSSPECVGREPDETYCVNEDVASCWPDGLDEVLEEECPAGCEDGACHEGRDPCPEGDAWLSCDAECPPAAGCSASLVPLVITDPETTFIVRTDSAETSRTFCDESTVGYDFEVGVPLESFNLRVSAPPPWRVGVPTGSNQWPCNMTMSQCAVGFFPDPRYPTLFVVTTEDLSAAPANVTVEVVDEGATCPE